MNQWEFLNVSGDFVLHNAQRYPGVYFPLVNEGSMMSSVTPWLAGDCKTDQNHFLLAPASMETLHESRSTRNLWILSAGERPWSVTGQSAYQAALRGSADEEETVLTGGLLWQKLARKQKKTGLLAEALSFVPAGQHRVEILQLTLTNEGAQPLTLTPVAAIPLYGRSAENLRDHRHVTSLLERVKLTTFGMELRQTLTFDERGHQKGDTIYRVFGGDEQGKPPEKFLPRVSDYIGSGSYDWPDALIFPEQAKYLTAGCEAQGGEMIGALWFAETVLAVGESRHYQIVMSIEDDPTPYLTPKAVADTLAQTKAWWQAEVRQRVTMQSSDFGAWAVWVGAQPILRRICGCSFLPHHDYGRGGRGWRDLWQDSLALLLANPAGVRDDLLSYCSGIRLDGTNATIIGAKPGEFKADRNGIPRVWMDHGFWPVLTTSLSLDETGDPTLLLEKQTYFRDALPWRGEDEARNEPSLPCEGTVLEHLLTQTVTAFFDVGEHGHIRLRGADWNDGLDLARERGESVAFTAAYAYGLGLLSDMTRWLAAGGQDRLTLRAPLWKLMTDAFGEPAVMRSALERYCASTDTSMESVKSTLLADRLDAMAQYIRQNIREREWVGDGAGQHWFNSYYDNDGHPLEGVIGDRVQIMLTGQVFCLLAGVAEEPQAVQLAQAVEKYLCSPSRGGYCLNTDFHEVKLNMGRMFGFAYGHKENGAVFCHMAVMYAYALYARGLAAEGARVLELLYAQSRSFSVSEILPGIPEYFDDRGKGMYPYLTGAASWFMLTLRTQVFGVRGQGGNLCLEPKLTAAQFDKSGAARITCPFAGHTLALCYRNPLLLDWGEYRIESVSLSAARVEEDGARCVIPREALTGDTIAVDVILSPIEAGGRHV
ncbi:MAG: cellobiose phosphorylase [Eubacteriales bacterium]|nr:cellobiose phosphorylase [Eubacteriales bacterium]